LQSNRHLQTGEGCEEQVRGRLLRMQESRGRRRGFDSHLHGWGRQEHIGYW